MHDGQVFNLGGACNFGLVQRKYLHRLASSNLYQLSRTNGESKYWLWYSVALESSEPLYLAATKTFRCCPLISLVVQGEALLPHDLSTAGQPPLAMETILFLWSIKCQVEVCWFIHVRFRRWHKMMAACKRVVICCESGGTLGPVIYIPRKLRFLPSFPLGYKRVPSAQQWSLQHLQIDLKINLSCLMLMGHSR
jgi:hypothetical protein